MVCLRVFLGYIRTSNVYRILVMSKPSLFVQDSMVHTRCTSVAVERLTLILTLHFLGISTSKDTLRHLKGGLCLVLHRVLTPTWTGLYTGKPIGEHLPVGMVLTLRFLHKGTTTKRSTGHTRLQTVASSLLQ